MHIFRCCLIFQITQFTEVLYLYRYCNVEGKELGKIKTNGGKLQIARTSFKPLNTCGERTCITSTLAIELQLNWNPVNNISSSKIKSNSSDTNRGCSGEYRVKGAVSLVDNLTPSCSCQNELKTVALYPLSTWLFPADHQHQLFMHFSCWAAV